VLLLDGFVLTAAVDAGPLAPGDQGAGGTAEAIEVAVTPFSGRPRTATLPTIAVAPGALPDELPNGAIVDARTLVDAGLIATWSAGISLLPTVTSVSPGLRSTIEALQRSSELARVLDRDPGSVSVGWYGDSDADLYRLVGYGIAFATVLLVLTAMAIGLGLARIEQRDDEMLLTALGAAPGFRRRAGALEAATLSGLAMVVALPLGLVLAMAIRTSISDRPIEVPWLVLLGMTVGIPLASVVLFGVTRRTPRRTVLDLR